MVVSTAFLNLLNQQEIMDIVDMVLLLTMKPKRSLKALMSPRRTMFMVCLAKMS